MENIKSTVGELDEIMENLDLGESSGYSDKCFDKNFNNIPTMDFTTQSGGVSDNNEDTWRPTGMHTSRIYQVCVIISEAAEDDDGGNNPVINPQNINQENNHMKQREKVYVSAREWRMMKSAVNHGTTILVESRREV
jgi:hypothetical protein